jgi:ABC-2 type transport system ATP-binding protein
MSETLLKVDKLSKQFGKLQAVSDLSFKIEKGSVYGLLGPNGSGKSTTLGIVLNVVNATSGSYEWFDGKASAKQALKKIGAIIERPNFYPYMSARENLELVCLIKQIPFHAVDKCLKEVGLFDRATSKFSTFSLGMKQRLAIASALLSDPEILILDEPTNGLDPQGIHQIRTLIQRIAAQGTTILLASHLLDEVEKVCDQVIILEKGQCIYSGSVKEMAEQGSYILVGASDINEVIKVAGDLEEVTVLGVQEGKLKITTTLSPTEVNRLFSSKSITLSHLSSHQKRLEELFLEITHSS